MDITEFFQLSDGKWFSQQTSHHLASQQTEIGKSNLRIEMLSKGDPVVVQLCQEYQVDPALALCGNRITWDGTVERSEKKLKGSTVLVAIADPQTPNQGKLLLKRNQAVKPSAAGRYIIGTDEALTLITEFETTRVEERLWFASLNLRLRTSTLKQSDGFSTTSFCSEIRMGGAQAAAKSTATTAQPR